MHHVYTIYCIHILTSKEAETVSQNDSDFYIGLHLPHKMILLSTLACLFHSLYMIRGRSSHISHLYPPDRYSVSLPAFCAVKQLRRQDYVEFLLVQALCLWLPLFKKMNCDTKFFFYFIYYHYWINIDRIYPLIWEQLIWHWDQVLPFAGLYYGERGPTMV